MTVYYDKNGITLEMVTVCSACRRESCWQGIFYCENYRTAGTVDVPKKPSDESSTFTSERPAYGRCSAFRCTVRRARHWDNHRA